MESHSMRLSRLSFVAASGAFLASCSGGGSIPRPSTSGSPGSADPASLRISARQGTTALGHSGFQVSSSQSGHALAIHTTSGDFLGSFAFGAAFTRSTSSNGSRLVLSAALPKRPGWYTTSSGRFKIGAMKSGAPATLAEDASGTQRLAYYTTDGLCHVVDSLGNRAAASMRASDGTYRIAAVVDNVGLWRGDDDFTGSAGAYPQSQGLIASPFASLKKPMIVKAPTPPSGGDDGGDGDFGDGYEGDLGEITSADDDDIGEIAFNQAQCEDLDFYGSAVGAAGLVMLFMPGMQVAAAAAGAVGGVAAILQHFGCGVTAGGLA